VSMVELARESEIEVLRERLQAQEQLLAKQKQDMDRQQSLLASVLHDIRSPLNVILVAAQVITDQTVRPERRQRNSQLLNTAAQSINSLCQDVLDFSKLAAGQMELSRITFHLRDCVVNLTDSVRLLAEKKGIEVNILVDDEAPTYLVGDPGRLRQILMNLMSNALKFTQQGSVEVRIKPQRIAADNHVWMDFEVADTGMGIHQEKLQNLFDPFRQAHGSLSTDLGGTGLGLAIAKQLVGCMGGELRVSSQPGKGTTFGFSACFGAKDQHEPRRPPACKRGVF
jgi:two-component system, sensor histidine kinase and response regulator